MKGKQLVISGVIAFVIIAYIFLELGYLDRFKPDAFQDSGVQEYKEEVKEQKQQSIEHPEKEALLLKMLDSVDYFHDVAGEFEIYNREMNQVTGFKYAVDTENKNGIGTVLTNNTATSTTIFLGTEQKKLVFDEQSHTYREFAWEPLPKDPELAKYRASERINSGKVRLDTEFTGYAGFVVDSEFIVFLTNFEDWQMEEVTFLDLPAYKLTGVIQEGKSESLSGNFEMVVEKNTGITLDFRSFDANNEVKYSITTQSINIDKGLAADTFTKDLTSYQKLDPIEINKDKK
ncbi:anti-sigma factor [Bacillaceae bacterium Marseille-Q3522]|nr:anti-sigma factor [Bacillaceae bacterium Marseille-Q3522]